MTRIGCSPSASRKPTPRCAPGTVEASQPADAQPWPRIVSDACGVLQRSASRKPNRSRSDDGTTSAPGFCVAAHDDHAGRTAARDEVAQQLGQLLALLAIRQREVERELVDDDQVQRQLVVAADLAQSAGEQLAVARVHLALHVTQQLDRLAAVRADEPLGDRRPRRELDELAVQQPHPRRRVERRRGDEQRQRDRLARAGLAADQHVALNQPDLDGLAVLVDTERDRIPQRPLLGARVGPRERRGVVERVATANKPIGTGAAE